MKHLFLLSIFSISLINAMDVSKMSDAHYIGGLTNLNTDMKHRSHDFPVKQLGVYIISARGRKISDDEKSYVINTINTILMSSK